MSNLMRYEIINKYADLIVNSIDLLFSRRFDKLVQLGILEESSIEFLRYAIEEFDSSYYAVPSRESILTSEIEPYEDMRGYQLFVEAPLSVVSNDADAVLVGFEILHSGSIKLVTVSLINHDRYRKEFLKKSSN